MRIAPGSRFDRLVVLASAGRTAWKELLWKCQCDCGAEATVRGKSLRAGRTRSCGCLINANGHGVTHGGKYTRLYRIWSGMRTRCHNPRAKDYPRYGGAGIFVCDEWRLDFAAFQGWANANGYGDTLTIDRIDGHRGYSPDNCRWVTAAENSRRTSNTKLTIEKAAIIRSRAAAGVSHAVIASEFQVSRSNVSLICEGKVWAA